MLPLSQAISLYKKEKGAISNAYDWYRRSAQGEGFVYIGGSKLKAEKVGNQWCVNSDAFNRAIEKLRKEQEKIRINTINYEKGIFQKTNCEVLIEGGGYRVINGFRYEWGDYERITGKSDGTWYCNNCNEVAKTIHDKKECHICSDWGSCGKDCTLSEVQCLHCKTSLKVSM